MFRTLTCLLLTVWLLSLAGCEKAPEPAPPGSSDRARDAPSESAAAGNDTPERPRDHTDVNVESLPLLPIMLRMSADMAGLMQALWVESYEDLATHARAIAAHAQISAEELDRIESELGPEMEAFEAADEAVHQASLRMQDAAEAGDIDAFLGHLATVQRGCVGCHSRFRERLRTNAR